MLSSLGETHMVVWYKTHVSVWYEIHVCVWFTQKWMPVLDKRNNHVKRYLMTSVNVRLTISQQQDKAPKGGNSGSSLMARCIW